MTNTLRIGQMPGTINEFALEAGTTLAQALEVAGLDASGFEVKIDGRPVTDFSTTVDGANLVLLSRQVKGNANVVRVGKMPGQILEFAFEPPTTFAEVLSTAGLDASGYEVKADGRKVTNFDEEIGGTQLVILSKQIKGNANIVRVGKMPGQILEFGFEPPTTFAEVLATANLDASGYEVKADGRKVTNFNEEIGSTQLIILSKQIKGN